LSGNSDNYWARAARGRYSRRSVLRGVALSGAGLAGASLLACKASPGGTGSSQQAAQAPQKPKSAISSMEGRTTTTEPPGDTPVAGGTLNWYMTGNPASLDPTQNVSVNTLYLGSGALSRVFRFKTPWDPVAAANQDTEPDLGASAESPDGVTWTVKLRPGSKFQNLPPVNGHAVEAEDIKASFVKATGPSGINAGNLSFIDTTQIQTPDKQTVVFKLKYPYAPFPKELASASYSWIFPREALSGDYDTTKKLIGSGPFVWDTYTPDVAVSWKKNPDYFEKGRPYVDAVKMAVIPDAGTRNAQFTGGHLDYLGMPLLDDVPTLQQQNPKAEMLKVITSGNGVMYYNLRDSSSVFQDIRVRQAVSLAMDRDAYAAGTGFKPGEYVQTFTVPPNVGKWAAMAEDYPADTMQWYKYDLAKAKQLMEAAGGSKITVRMLYPAGNPADPQLGRQAEIAFSMLKQLPWNISYSTVDYNKDWINGGKGIGYPGGGVPADAMAWWGWSARTEVDEYLYSFWHSKGAGNFGHYDDPQIDAGIEKARTVLNEDDRVNAYKDVQRYIASKVYVLMGMMNGQAYYFTAPHAHNYRYGDTYSPGTATWAQMWLKG
jgi:peptide/nickel transport system substrate-binding protein